MRRPRGPGGRFLTADEVAAIESGQGGPLSAESDDKENMQQSPSGKQKPIHATSGSGQKRKAGGMSGGEPATKKNKNVVHRASTSAEESEDVEDDEEGDDDA